RAPALLHAAPPRTAIIPLSLHDALPISGNPNLGAQESEIYNLGFSWLPFEGFSFDLDYQEIEYIGRISSLVTADVTRRELNRFRSEEHTSELQSRENLVCRLLLEKKKAT